MTELEKAQALEECRQVFHNDAAYDCVEFILEKLISEWRIVLVNPNTDA